MELIAVLICLLTFFWQMSMLSLLVGLEEAMGYSASLPLEFWFKGNANERLLSCTPKQVAMKQVAVSGGCHKTAPTLVQRPMLLQSSGSQGIC